MPLKIANYKIPVDNRPEISAAEENLDMRKLCRPSSHNRTLSFFFTTT